jgi:hypothetical protein
LFIAPSVFSNIINVKEYRRGNKNGQSTETGNIGYTDTGQINLREYRRGNEKGQSRETGNIGYTRHRTNKC